MVVRRSWSWWSGHCVCCGSGSKLKPKHLCHDQWTTPDGFLVYEKHNPTNHSLRNPPNAYKHLKLTFSQYSIALSKSLPLRYANMDFENFVSAAIKGIDAPEKKASHPPLPPLAPAKPTPNPQPREVPTLMTLPPELRNHIWDIPSRSTSMSQSTAPTRPRHR